MHPAFCMKMDCGMRHMFTFTFTLFVEEGVGVVVVGIGVEAVLGVGEVIEWVVVRVGPVVWICSMPPGFVHKQIQKVSKKALVLCVISPLSLLVFCESGPRGRSRRHRSRNSSKSRRSSG